MQKTDFVLSKESALELNRKEFEHYKQTLERSKTRYVIVSEEATEDGSYIVHVKKQYNDSTDVAEYFA